MGNIVSPINYLNDNRHGSYKKYSEKGIIVEEGNYYNDNPHGETKIYDVNGKLKETHVYYYGTLLTVKK